MTLPVAEGLGLPSSVVERVRHAPAEDILLAIFRAGLPGMSVVSKIPMATMPFFVLARRIPDFGLYGGRRGLIDEFDATLHVYTEDPDGDLKAGLISDAVCDVAEQAFQEHWAFPDLGSVNKIQVTQGPARMTDWATSVGPVQYADLPTGNWRYEVRMNFRINPPSRG